MAITINAKGTSVTSFAVGKNGTSIGQLGTITPPANTDLTIVLDEDKNVVIDAGGSGPALITASNDQDLHINPATGGGQYLVINDVRFPATDGTTNQVLTTNGSGILSWATPPGTGTVTDMSVATANGFAGSVATSTTTPAVTISTTITGLLNGNGTSVSSAISGMDYSYGTSALGTGIVKSTTATGTLTIAVPGDFPTLNQNTTGSAATLTTARDISASGDAVWTVSFNGSTNATAALTLATVNSNVGAFGTASSVGSFTVNGKGLITAASNTAILIAETQITNGTLLARNADDETITGNWTFNNPVVGANPTIASNFATKQYVDDAVNGLSWKTPARVATTANITLSGPQTIDGISAVAGNRVLVKNQSTTSQNGIYVVAAGAWTRSTDFDSVTPVDEINGAAVYVNLGSTQAATSWTQTAEVVTVGTDPIIFVQFAGPGSYVAGDGLTLTGNTFDVVTASSARIVVNVNDIDLATTAVTPASYGSATQSGTFTVDAYGRLTAASATTITPAFASITGLPTTLGGYGITNGVLKTGDTMTGVLATTVAGFGIQPRLNSSTSFSGVSVSDAAGARKLELLYLGPTQGGAYGAAQDTAVINASGSLGLTISTQDAARIGIGGAGNVTFAAPSSGVTASIASAGSGNQVLQLTQGGSTLGFSTGTTNGSSSISTLTAVDLTLSTNSVGRMTIAAAGGVTIAGAAGINGKAAVANVAAPAVATDLASVIALANDMRTRLINFGIYT